MSHVYCHAKLHSREDDCIRYASPVDALIKASRARSLGDINALPFAVTVANTIVWCTYGELGNS
jgi:hypothetical protein